MSEFLLPWNLPLAQRIARNLDHLPHALLLAGPAGLGKNRFATWLAQRLLCQQATDALAPCGRCQGCQLVAAGSHPDLHVIQPEAVYRNSDALLAHYAVRYPPEDKSRDSKDSVVIRINQIRALIGASQTRPQLAARKVLILSPADRMNVNAANSLLKLLEEPPADSQLLLVASRPGWLPATIRSRCSRIEFRIPEPATARAWLAGQGMTPADAGRLLALAGGMPLEALTLATHDFLSQRDQLMTDLDQLLAGQGDPLACAGRWRQLGSDLCLRWLQGWLADLIRTGLHPETGARHNPDAGSRLQAQKKRLHLKRLFGLAQMAGQRRQMLGGSVDEQLLLEDLLIHWAESSHT